MPKKKNFIKKYASILFLGISFGNAQIQDFKVAKLHEIETVLEVKIKKKEIQGTHKFVLSPYFYDLKNLTFEAKNITIQNVLLGNKPVNYHYKQGKLEVFFAKNYTKNDTLQITVQHRQKLQKNSEDNFLLLGTFKKYCPFPEKILYASKQKIIFKVPKNYQTLTAGTLFSQKKNKTQRTDYWQILQKQNLEKIFFAVGKFHEKTSESKGKKYHFYSNLILKNKTLKTQKNAKIIAFFEKITGRKYPYKSYKELLLKNKKNWKNFQGIIVNFFENKNFEAIYGRMERDFQNAVQIAKQWTSQIFFKTQQKFSDEKLAYFLGYLWLKKNYKPKEMEVYKSLVLEHYFENPLELKWIKNVFVFEMLAKQIGNQAIIKGIQNYFRKNEHSETFFRANLEEITGKNLRLFFGQWFEKTGYPTVEAHTDYNTIEKTLTLTFEQKNSENFAYYLPVHVKFYYKNHTETRFFWIQELQNSFTMVYREIPEWISVNADKMLFGQFKISQNLSGWMYQYLHSPYYEDKKNALKFLLKKQSYEKVFPILEKAFADPFTKNKILLLESINLVDKFSKRTFIGKIETLAKHANNPFLKAAATKALGKLVSNQYYGIFMQNFQEKHPKIKAAALEALYYLNSKKALKLAQKLKPEVKHSIGFPLSKLYLKQKQKEEMTFVAPYILQGIYLVKDEKNNAMFREALFWIAESENLKALKILVADMVKKGNQYKKYNFHLEMIDLIRKLILAQEKLKTNRKPFVKILENGIEQLTESK